MGPAGAGWRTHAQRRSVSRSVRQTGAQRADGGRRTGARTAASVSLSSRRMGDAASMLDVWFGMLPSMGCGAAEVGAGGYSTTAPRHNFLELATQPQQLSQLISRGGPPSSLVAAVGTMQRLNLT